MTFKEWKQKQQARNLARLTPERREKMIATTELRWQKMQARGLAFFLITRTLAIFAWMCCALAGFGYVAHLYKVMQQPWYLLSTLPMMFLLALALTVLAWVAVRNNARNLRQWRTDGRI